jgi:single-stranded-DNA-specific exonuclease
VALAPAEAAGVLKGSARSIPGLHVRDALAQVAARGRVAGLEFGGHAMAAGLRLPLAALADFQAEFAAVVAQLLGDLDLGEVLWTDGPLAASELTLELAEALQFAAPWGQAFPEPLFDNEFDVLDRVVLRGAHLRLSLRHVDGGAPVEAIAFNETRDLPPRARFLYRLGVNDYGGRRRRQLVVEHIRSD